MHEFLDGIAPHPDGVDPVDDLLHERCYVVRAYRADDTTLILRGALRDQKPPGLYIADDDGNLIEADPTVKLGDLEALQGVVKFPVRIKCATLAWNTLLDALSAG